MAKIVLSWASSHVKDSYLTDNLTDGFVTRDERERGDELALVDVKIGTADAAGLRNMSIASPLA